MSNNFEDGTKQLIEPFSVKSKSTKEREYIQNGKNDYPRFQDKEHKESYSFHSLLDENIKEELKDSDRLDEFTDNSENGNIMLEPSENCDNENPRSPKGSNFSNKETNSFDNLSTEMPRKESGNLFENPDLLIQNMLKQSLTLMNDKNHIQQPIDLSVNNNKHFQEHTNLQAVIHNIPGLMPLSLGTPLLLKTLQNNLQQRHPDPLNFSPNNNYTSFRELLQHSLNIANLYSKFKKVTAEDYYSGLSGMTYPEIKKECEEDSEEMFCMDGITGATKVENGEFRTEFRKNENSASLPTDFDKTDPDYSKVFKCQTCSKDFLTKSRLTKHLLTHSEQSYSCSHCDFTTKRKDYLRVHELNHLETKMYKCSKCNFGTNVRSRLKIHENIHLEEKSFKCSSCPYMTSRKDNLKLHELNHLETKRFKCDQCVYASNNKRNLKEHLMNHLDLKLFKCPDCPYETNKKGNLKLHQVKHIPKAFIPDTLRNPLPNSNPMESADASSKPFILSTLVANSVVSPDFLNTKSSKEFPNNLVNSENFACKPIKTEEDISENLASDIIKHEDSFPDLEDSDLNPYSFKNLVNDSVIPQDSALTTIFRKSLSSPISN